MFLVSMYFFSDFGKKIGVFFDFLSAFFSFTRNVYCRSQRWRVGVAVYISLCVCFFNTFLVYFTLFFYCVWFWMDNWT